MRTALALTNSPGVRLLAPEGDPQEGRLARPVAAHEADLLARVVLPGDVPQHLLGAVALADAVETVQHGADSNRETRTAPASRRTCRPRQRTSRRRKRQRERTRGDPHPDRRRERLGHAPSRRVAAGRAPMASRADDRQPEGRGGEAEVAGRDARAQSRGREHDRRQRPRQVREEGRDREKDAHRAFEDAGHVLREAVHDLPEAAVHPEADTIVGHRHPAAPAGAAHADREPDVVDDRALQRLVASRGAVGRGPDEHPGAAARGEPLLEIRVDQERRTEEVRHGEVGHQHVLPEAVHLDTREEREEVDALRARASRPLPRARAGRSARRRRRRG